MTFRIFKQNKLWRDKAVELMENTGSVIHWKRLTDEEFANELRTKFIEEAYEVFSAPTNEKLIEELADVLKVMGSLCNVHGFTMEDIMAAQRKKNEERGDFNGRKFITIAKHKIGSFGDKYCLADPEKYPEIIG